MPRAIDPAFKLKLASLLQAKLAAQPDLLQRGLRGLARVTDPQALHLAQSRAANILAIRQAQIDAARSPTLRAKLIAQASQRKAMRDSVRQRLQSLNLRTPAKVLSDYGGRLLQANPDRKTTGGLVIRAGTRDPAMVQNLVAQALGLGTAAQQAAAGMSTRLLPVEASKGSLFEIRFTSLSIVERRELHNVAWALRRSKKFGAVRVSSSLVALCASPEPNETKSAQRVFAWHLEAIRALQAHTMQVAPGVQTKGGGAVIAHFDTGWTQHSQYNVEHIDQAHSHSVLTGRTGGNAAMFSHSIDDKGFTNITHGLATGSLMVGGKINSGNSGIAAIAEDRLDFPLTAISRRDYGSDQKIRAKPGRLTGVAPEATVLPIKFIPDAMAEVDSSGFQGAGVFRILDSHMIDAAEYARQQNAHVISMSVGGVMLDAFKQKLDDLVINHGMIVVAAAGQTYMFNAASGLADAIALLGIESDDSVIEPASFSNVIAVGGSTPDMHPWVESHRGPNVDIAAPADGVWVAELSPTQTISVTSKSRAETLECASGTSFATAITAGVAALWVGFHGAAALSRKYRQSPIAWVFRHLLVQTAQLGPTGDWDTSRYGGGIVNAQALMQAPLPDDGTVPAPPATLRNMFADLSDILEEDGERAAALLVLIEDGARPGSKLLDDARDGAAVLVGALLTQGREAARQLVVDWNAAADTTQAWVQASIAQATQLAQQFVDAVATAEETAVDAGDDAVEAAGDFIVDVAQDVGEVANDLVDWVLSSA